MSPGWFMVRYYWIPNGLGVVADCVVLAGAGDNLTWTRLLAGASLIILVPLAINLPQLWWHSHRTTVERRRP